MSVANLLARIESDYLQAMKKKEAELLNVLRLLKSALKNESIALIKPELNDEEVIKVLRRELKKRQEAILAFKQGNRPELATQEEKELVIIKGYLPPEATDQQINEVIQEIIKENNFLASDFGKIMKLATAKLAGSADGSRISALVKKIFAGDTLDNK